VTERELSAEVERLRALNAELVEAHNTLLIETARPTTVYDCAHNNARYAQPCDRCPATSLERDAVKRVVEWLRRPGGNPGLHPFHVAADAIERKFLGR
jgi:hypothetical protein